MVKFTIVKTTTGEVMVIYKTKMFKNSFKKMPINDAALIDIANEVYAGHFEADLGGGLSKNGSVSMEKERVVELEQLYFINREVIYSLLMDGKNLT